MSEQFDRRQVDEVVVFTLCEPFENDIFDDLREMLAAEDSRRIVLDLSPRPFYEYSDADYGNLVSVSIFVMSQQKLLRLVAHHTPHHAQLDGSHFQSVLPPVYETVEEAIRSF